MVKPLHERSKSFRVCIDERDNCKIFNPDIWPANMLVCKWIFKKAEAKKIDSPKIDDKHDEEKDQQRNDGETTE